MIYATDQLLEAFELGFESEGKALPPELRDLYWIQFFLIDYESGGWLYNWTGMPERFDAVIPAMRRRGLNELGDLVSRIRELLQPIERLNGILEAEGQTLTWSEMLEIVDPEGELDALEARINALPDYGLPESW